MSDKTIQPDFDDELLSAYLDDELSPEERARVEARLESDPAARQMLDELRQVSEALRKLPRETMPVDVRESIAQRAVEARRTAATTADDGVLGPQKFTIGRTRRGWFWASLAVAAGLAIMFVQRETLDEEDSMSVANRRDGVPSIAAAPESPPMDEARPAAGRIAESESAAPASAVPEGSALDAAADGVAAEEPATPAVATDENQLVIVHVLAKREALENNAFERLLVSNGVRVEPAMAEAETNRAARRSRAVASRVSGEPAEANEGDGLDVVLVEAPPPTILSCLEEINNDHANYLSVSVDESSPVDERPAPPESVALGVKVAPMKKLALDLGKYNRGIVPPRQKALFAPNKQQYFAQAAEEKLGGRGGAAVSRSQAEPDATFEYRAEGAAAEGRAQRLIVPGLDERRLKELGRLAIPSNASTATDANQLQVLFVLAPGEESPAASPAAENRPE